MDDSQFRGLHADCIAAMRAYVVEAEKSCAMLGKCTFEPLSFAERLVLLSQEIVENDARTVYLSAKALLHSAARLGYGFST
jgi:hypothetical protein